MATLRPFRAARAACRARLAFLLSGVVVVGVIATPAVAADQYTVVDLAPAQTVAYLGGPAAINASGTVAGTSGSPERAFRHGSTFQSLGVLGGGANAQSYGYGINTAGWVVGWSSTGRNSPGPAHAFRHNGISMTDLGVIKKGGFSAAYDINDQNLVVGETVIASGAVHAFKYDTQLRDLGTLAGYTDSRAYAVNGSGVIVGRLYNGTAVHAFLHDGTTMRDIGTLGGPAAEAYDINDNGIVVGYSSTGFATHAFRYDGTTMADIAPSVAYAVAYGVNNTGDIVGTTSTSPNGSGGHAFLYRDNQLVDLNTLIPAGSAWVLTDATDINDQGQITGIGTFNGDRRVYRLDLSDVGLLERFAPELRYHPFETYRADAANSITDTYVAGQYTNRLLDAGGSTIAASDPADPSPETLSLSFLGQPYTSGLPSSAYDRIDENNDYAIDFQRMHALSTYANRIYGRVIPGSGSLKILQYWFFFYYNPKSYLGFGVHEGDWEMMQLTLDASNMPLEATYSQHHDGERCDWNHVPRTSSRRPIVYAAEGSHANYFSPGYHLNGGANDYTADDGEHVVPAVVDIASSPPWTQWPGQWGGSAASPTGPGLKPQWTDPTAWAAPFGCTEGQVFPAVSSGNLPPALHGNRSVPTSPPTAAASVSGRIRGDEVLVRYELANPDLIGEPGAHLIASVRAMDAGLVPITERFPIRARSGVLVLPRGLGSGEFRVSLVVVDSHGVMSDVRTSRVQGAS